VRRLLGAWEAATNGQPQALDGLAAPSAVRQLLAPAPGLPRVIREPQLRRTTPVELDGTSDPPTVVVLCSVRAHPDIWHLDLGWELTLTNYPKHPWRLTNAVAFKDAYFRAGK